MTDERPPGGGHEDPLLRAVAEYWGDIQRAADPQQLERLTALLAGTAEADPGVARAELTDLLLDVLPPRHPLIEWLRTVPMLYGGGKQDPDAVTIGPGHLTEFAISTVGDAGTVPVTIYLTDETDHAGTVPVTIYLTDETDHAAVEAALETFLVTAGLLIVEREEPVIGSWFRRLTVRAKDGMRSQASQDAALTAAHVLDARLILGQDAEVTAKLLANLGPVISALQPQKSAVIRAGALLIVKQEDDINVMQLTAAQQARLDHQPRLAWSPYEIVAALSVAPDHRSVPGAEAAAVLDLYVEEPVLGQDSRFLREAGVSFGRPRVAPVPDDELPPSADRWVSLPRMRVSRITLPFDLEEPPDDCRYTETTVKMTFDDPDVVALELSRPPAGAGENGADDSMLDTWGAGRQQLTWKLSARDEQSGLRPAGREVQAVLGAPLAAERLTGRLDAWIRFTRPESGGTKRITAGPQHPLRFTLDVTDGTFETSPEESS